MALKYLTDILLPRDPPSALNAATKQYVDNTTPQSYTQLITGGTSVTITHNLGTMDVVIAVYRVSDGVEVDVPLTRTSINAVTLNSVIDLADHRIVIIGVNV